MSVWLQEARAYPNGVVATPHYLASAAGAAMLADGGNAVDAAVAANLVLAIVTPYMCGFGGDLLTMALPALTAEASVVPYFAGGATQFVVLSGSGALRFFGPLGQPLELDVR